MANDGEVRIATTLDTSQLQKQIDGLKNRLDRAAKKLSAPSEETKKFGIILNETSGAAGGFVNKMSNLASTAGPYVAAAVAVIGSIKKIGEVMRETTETYKVQEKAEKALTLAAENSPYINNEGVQALKEYAGELQKISNIGDETSIQLMAQLVSTGRTQEEIQKIMSAAADYAAATQTDINTAVQTLNSTYSGMAGTMGRQISAIKELTEEELKQGKAIDIIADKYKGMAQSMADARVQAENAKGDFNEAIGKLAQPTVNAWDNFWKSFYDKGTSTIQSITEALENASRNWVIGGIKRSVDEGVQIVSAIYKDKATGKEQTGAYFQNTEYLKFLEKELKLRKNLNSEEKTALIYIQSELQYRANVVKYEQAQANAAEKKAKQEAELAAIRKTTDDYAKSSNKELESSLRRLEVEAKAKGVAVTAQDKYNVILKNYISLLTDTEGLIKEGYPIEKKRLSQLEEAKRALEEETDAQNKLKAATEATKAVIATIQDMQVNPTPSNALSMQQQQYKSIREQVELLTEEQVEAAQAGNDTIYTKQQLIEGLVKSEIELEKQKVDEVTKQDKSYYEEYSKKQQELLDIRQALDESEVLSAADKAEQMKKIDEDYMKNKTELWSKVTQEISAYTQQTVDIAKQAGDLILESVKTSTELELAELDVKYRKGEISEQDYYDKQIEIKRKAAREEYKIQMFQWTASILAATANIAEGVSRALTLTPPLGFINGALVSAAGGVQLASIIANKPIPPSFATGGVVGGMNGASMGSDNTYIHARTGELILNAYQQRDLWNMLNGQQSKGSGGLNLTVNNTQAGIVNTSIREENNGIYIDILDKHINKGLSDGTFDAGYSAMQTRQEGVRIL